MYLARLHDNGRTTYWLRQSYTADACMKSRDLFELGPDPTKFIRYPGGNSYYYDPDMIEAIEENGGPADDDTLDRILFPFLHPRIRKIITDFDRERDFEDLNR